MESDRRPEMPEEFRRPTREERARELAEISALWGSVEYTSVTGEVIEIPPVRVLNDGEAITLQPSDPSI